VRVTPGKSLREAAARAVADPTCAVVVAGGGDGTVNAVAGVLAGTEKPLGVLPLGTLNHFAKDLGIPHEVERAVQLLGTGAPRRVDVAEVNGRVFVNNSSIGVYPLAVRER
jgi:diacylglycerol kinase family enzyme